jgi:hypothetical protein
VKTLCAAVVAHPAIKELGYGLQQVLFSSFLSSSPPASLNGNASITDASCPALADLLRVVPALENLG